MLLYMFKHGIEANLRRLLPMNERPGMQHACIIIGCRASHGLQAKIHALCCAGGRARLQRHEEARSDRRPGTARSEHAGL